MVAVGADQIVIVKRRNDSGFDELRFDHPAVTGNVFIVVLDFIALHREASVVAAVVAGDVIIFKSQDVERETKTQILIAVEGQAAGPKRSALAMSVGFLIPGGDIGTDITYRDALNRCDEWNLHQVDPQASSFSSSDDCKDR